jgi:hypothetical protein
VSILIDRKQRHTIRRSQLAETERPEREPFHRASRPMSTLAVLATPEHQRQARLLIAGGCIGLEDGGRIVEVGTPLDRRDIGRVFQPVTDPWTAAAIQLAETLVLIGRHHAA